MSNEIHTEWELREKGFRTFQAQHGAVLEVDLFASPLNFKVQRFFLPIPSPLGRSGRRVGSGLEPLPASLAVFPPPVLIGLVAEKLSTYQGGGVLVVNDRPDFLRL